MAYGTAAMRAYYGAGDYSSSLALRQAAMGYAPGYYPAGGWFSSLTSGIGKAWGGLSRAVAPIASVAKPLLGTVGKKVMGAIPLVGTALAAYDIGKAAIGAFKGGGAPAHTVSVGPGGLGVSFASGVPGGTPLEKARAAGHVARAIHGGAKRVAGAYRRHRRRRAVAKARRRHARHARRAGDYSTYGTSYYEGDAARNRRGRFMKGHRPAPRRRRHHRHHRRHRR